jgi:hypothetical protein
LKKFLTPKIIEARKSMNLSNEKFANLAKIKDKDTRILNNTMPPSNYGHRPQELQVEAIQEWQGNLSTLENEVLALEAKMSFLHETKDNNVVEFLRVANQMKDRQLLIQTTNDI